MTVESRPEVLEIQSRADRIRRLVLEMAYAAQKGHIGPALSIADIIAVLATRRYGETAEEQSALVLSKGHAASALYAALMDLGVLPKDVRAYCADGSEIATHPMATTPGIDFSTGSLGQGITFAVGAALGSRLVGRFDPVWCVLSDSELNEGSTWEAAQIAASNRLGNLVVVLDLNGQQATALTDDVLPTRFVPTAWASMGWDVEEVDGHDVDALMTATLHDRRAVSPRLVVARTVAGKGVSFMEGQIAWHYLPLSDEQHEIALHELAGRLG